MAFTADEENVLKQVVSAFQNGKRLQDLPEVSGGSNPFDLVTEVLDTDGESKQARLASFLPYAEETCAYGVQLDTTISATTLPASATAIYTAPCLFRALCVVAC